MNEPSIIAVVADLMFTAKILDAAKRAGRTVRFVADGAKALALAGEGAAMIVIDLNHDRAEPVKLISELKANDTTRGIPVVGYLSHVQVDLKRKAEEAGCDQVFARSAFSDRLPQILAR